MEDNRPFGIDLCSGVGGMSLGFEQAGFNIVASVDIDPIHCSLHQENFPECKSINKDISDVSGSEIISKCNLKDKVVDVIFGGPPCGGFSLIGKRIESDPRNSLIMQFSRIISEIKPKYFVIENVRGILIGEMRKVVDEFIEEIESFEYQVAKPIKYLNAYDFGVPQKRERVFLLGSRVGLKSLSYPAPLDSDNNDRPSVWDAIGDLPNVDDFEELIDSDIYTGELLSTSSRYALILRGELKDSDDLSLARSKEENKLSGCQQTKHYKETIARFKKTLPGHTESVSRLYRLSKDKASRTLRAGTGKDRGSYSAPRPIHPVFNRCITVREGARLHSFPDWFQFHHTKWHGFRQIGNAVPPLLARAVAKKVYELI
ncbi:MAG: DNA cytosine methyltransferase [Pseudomonadota bacterium]|nr:DNA cytosine methyltransferase [Pseudomonadota bacterium]